jgi:hypothetical protein
MANVDAAFGLVPIRHMSGNAPRTNKYTLVSGYAENIFKGDLVVIIVTGLINVAATNEVNNIGVFDGCSYTASDGSYVYSEYWPTGTVATDIVVYVYDDPYTVFKVQSAGAPDQADLIKNANIVAGAGSTVTGQSGFEISGTTAVGTAQLKIIALYDTPDNAFGTNAIMEVLISEHLLKDATGI